MIYKEWLEKNPNEAAKVKKFTSYGGSINKADGTIDADKIMNMHIMMVMTDCDGDVQITLC